MKKLVVIRGGGELATGIAHRLHNTGFQVLMLEKAAPSAIRRDIVFAEAVYDGEKKVERTICTRADSLHDAEKMLKNGQIFGIKINGEVHNNYSGSYSIMWSQHWEDCGETQRVEVTNVVDVQDPRSNYRSNYIPHL